MLYSPTTGGFYAPGINTEIPDDALEVAIEDYAALLAGQADGGMIQPGDGGAPVLVAAPAPTPEERRAAWRMGATADRAGFLKSLVRAGLLPPADAVLAARGEWPAAFAAALQSLPFDPVDAQIDWAAATKVSRMHPLFLGLLSFYAGAAGLDVAEAEALGDEIFGWVEPVAEAPSQPEPPTEVPAAEPAPELAQEPAASEPEPTAPDQPPEGQAEEPTVDNPEPGMGE